MGEDLRPKADPAEGLLVLGLRHIHNLVSEKVEFSYKIEISHFEIYNDQVYDLLKDDIEKISICEDRKSKEFFLKGVESVESKSLENSFETIMKGELNRKVAITEMNHQSS